MTITINLPRRDGRPTGLACGRCPSRDASSLTNGLCPTCWEAAQTAWQIKMAIRQDPAQFDMDKLVKLLLTQHWMHECQIIPDFMPNFPREDTRPTCVVRYYYEGKNEHTFLRYSKGPLQGYFWDVYGDDFHSPELALLAIIQAPAPTRVGTVIPTHGR